MRLLVKAMKKLPREQKYDHTIVSEIFILIYLMFYAANAFLVVKIN